MNIFTFSWKNIMARPWQTFLSLLLIMMGVSVISMLLQMNRQLEKNFNKNISGINMVIGAKGSPLQLILASVYHIDNPTGNISLQEVQKWVTNPVVEKWIPLSYGDNYKGYRILGTNHLYPGHYEARLAEGKLWENSFEVTLGAIAAQRLNLGLGDEFQGAHGLVGEVSVHKEKNYKVVGILQPTGTVVDQLILTGLNSVWEIHEHAEDHHAESDSVEEDREITAVLIKARNPAMGMMVARSINDQSSMQAALPAIEINRLFGLFAVGIDTLKILAWVIMIISGISVFVSLYSSLKTRRYDMAMLRAMGASPFKLFSFIMLEGILLAVLGFILGILLSRSGLFFLGTVMEADYNFDFSGVRFMLEELSLFGFTLLIGIGAALIPGLQAYFIPLSKELANG
ncbi:MAG: ABC transporter permease [Bacteroidetes bacterium]|nr:ABC transporter permease [Bacteroidota bacterium]